MIFKNILIGLIFALAVVQLYRNFGSLLDDRSQIAKENLVSLLVMGVAIFVYQWIAGGFGG